MSDLDRTPVIPSDLIKQLTGGAPLDVRHLVGFCEEPPEFRLKISGRHAPDSPDREQ